MDRQDYYDLGPWYTDMEREEPQTYKDSQLPVSFLHWRYFLPFNSLTDRESSSDQDV